MSTSCSKEERVPFVDLVALLQRIFVSAGVAENTAHILALNCATCERDGSVSHGIFRIPGYLSSLRVGWVDGHAVPIVEDVGTAFVRVDACNGFAQPALSAALPSLLCKVQKAGAAVLAIRNSHHFSALWPDVEPLARSGLVAMTCVSGLACVVPPGGWRPVLGTNPIAFAVPVAGSDPLVFDQATSAISNGELRIAVREGRDVPVGCGVDCHGQPTVDPRAILEGGSLLPFGRHKGAAISLMVEILASALTGGQFSTEVDFSDHPGAETPNTGQFMIVVDPERGAPTAVADRVRHLIGYLRAAGQERFPGERRYVRRRVCEETGVLINVAQLEQLRSFA